MLNVLMLSVAFFELLCRMSHFLNCCAECLYAECHYAECHYAEGHYAECRYAECRYDECWCAKCHGANKTHYLTLRIGRWSIKSKLKH
jgi:hypothetical protein